MKNLIKLFSRPEKQITLPEVIRHKQDLLKYKPMLENIPEFKDPLRLRINIKEFDPIAELPKQNKLKTSLRKVLAKLNIQSPYEMSLQRINNPAYMTPHFAAKVPNSHIFHWKLIALVVFLMSFAWGYASSRAKYDLYCRRVGFSIYPTVMLLFEAYDSAVKAMLDKYDEYLPRDLTSKEFEYILYRKFLDRKVNRELRKDLDRIELLSKEVQELDEVLRKVA